MEPHTAAQQLGQGLQLARQQLLGRGHRAADGEPQHHLVSGSLDDTRVQRGLHKPWHVHAHGLHAPRHQEQSLAHPLDGCGIQHGKLPAARLGQLQADIRVCGAVLGFHLGGKVGSGGADFFGDSGGQHKRHAALLGDDIFLSAAGDALHGIHRAVIFQQGQVASQQGDGVGTAFVDLGAGVSALQAEDIRLHGGAGQGGAGHRQMALRPAAACAARGQHALFLRVDVDEQAALKVGKVHGGSAQQTHLFADGQHHFQSGVGKVLCVQHGQRIGHGNAVIAAQRRALGADVTAVHHRADGVFFQIQRAVSGLVAHHVQMPL